MSAPKEIVIDGTKFIRADSVPAAVAPGPDSIIRTRSAGVHIGEVESRTGAEVVLKNARRLWSWQGALTLNEVATKGVSRSNSKISVAVPIITLLEAIEVIPVNSNVNLTPTQ